MPLVLPFLTATGLILIGLGVLLNTAGLVTDIWEDYTQVVFHVRRGLYVTCIEERCIEVKDTTERQACKALLILGIALGAVGALITLVFLILIFCKKAGHRITPLIASGISFASFISSIIGVIIYVTGLRTSDRDREWGVSLRLAIAGPVILLVGAILVLITRRWMK